MPLKKPGLTQNEVDFFAVYYPPAGSIFVVPRDACAGGFGCLRLEPVLNGQQKLIRWARDFTWEKHVAGLQSDLLPADYNKGSRIISMKRLLLIMLAFALFCHSVSSAQTGARRARVRPICAAQSANPKNSARDFRLEYRGDHKEARRFRHSAFAVGD